MRRNWRQDYNQRRPHSSLGYRAPETFAGLQRWRPIDLTALSKSLRRKTLAATSPICFSPRKSSTPHE
ncbi:MAG: transposase [Acidobacteriales bacterium]|nr:transposase [Terriglobales bacterium]